MNECEREGMAGNCGIECPVKFCGDCSYLETIKSQPWSLVIAGNDFDCFGCEHRIERYEKYWGQPDGLEFCIYCYEEFVLSQKGSKSPTERHAPQPKPKTETTHSCVLEFPNGEVIEIPGPEGAEWSVSEVTRQFWQRQHVHSLLDGKYIKHINTGHLSWKITHSEGLMLAHEYEKRVNKEHPVFITVTQWERTAPKSKPQTTMLHSALMAFPLLNGLEK